MPTLFFSHPQISDALQVNTGMDDIEWGYNLNTQTYPTYGGEVVQILSAFTDNITINGTVRAYWKIEEIYGWFLTYMQIATQGRPGSGVNYTQDPVTLTYPERNWTWLIHPLSLPGFRYGREVVTPTWSLQAAVKEDPKEVQRLNLIAAQEGIQKVSPGIGFREDNPFSDPFAGQKDLDTKDLNAFYERSADYFSSLIPKYMKGDYESLLGEVGSKPAFLDNRVPGKGRQEKPSQK